MIKVLLVIFFAGHDPLVVLSKTSFDKPGQCEKFIDDRTDGDLGVFLANIDAKVGAHAHVAISCVMTNKGKVVPDV